MVNLQFINVDKLQTMTAVFPILDLLYLKAMKNDMQTFLRLLHFVFTYFLAQTLIWVSNPDA